MRPLWALDLSALTPGVREIDDIQLGPDGTLYLNSNYQSYAKEVDGQTARLFAVDPCVGTLRWKTGPLVSRGEFMLLDGLIVAGYGFTAEDDFLYAIRASDGGQLDKLHIPSAHDRIRRLDDSLQVATYDALLEVRIER